MSIATPLLTAGAEPAQERTRSLSTTLNRVRVEPFAAVRPSAAVEEKAKLVDSSTTLAKAGNATVMLKKLGLKLTDAQSKYLSKNKFLLIPITKTALGKPGHIEPSYDHDEMLIAFKRIGGEMDPANRQQWEAKLITPDIALHAFHKFLENALESIEATTLTEKLTLFLVSAQQTALYQMRSADGPLRDHWETVAAQFTCPLILLQNREGTVAGTKAALARLETTFKPETIALLKTDLGLVYRAQGAAPSPLFQQYIPSNLVKMDYTQFTPRSHYTKTPKLAAYFRAMMWLGRNGYFLNAEDSKVGATDATLAAWVIGMGMADQVPLAQVWREMADLTGFFAGQSDDITYPEWSEYLVGKLGTSFGPQAALETPGMTKVRAGLDDLRAPEILTDVVAGKKVTEMTKTGLLEELRAFRIFGQRFNFDAWAFGQLTGTPKREEGVKLPSRPSAVFIPAALGSAAARGFCGQFLEREFKFSSAEVTGWTERLDAVAAKLAKASDEAWYASLSSQWLHLLGTLTATYGEGYPSYMQSPEFAAKQVQSFLGSYTELKHDTVLYAKQSSSEMGGGEDDRKRAPVVRGFVEPNVRFWTELLRLAEVTKAGFAARHLLPETIEEYGALSNFEREMAFCLKIATQELRGEAISEQDYETMRYFSLDDMAAPLDHATALDENSRRSSLVTDIYTDNVESRIVYEATGKPLVMLVLVGNEKAPRLTCGIVYNHYEFTAPYGGRLTDEIWKKQVYGSPDSLPPKSFWYEGLTPR